MITPEEVYELMGYEDPDAWIYKKVEENWEEMKKTYVDDGREYLSCLSARCLLEELASGSGRTTQMIVHGLCEAFKEEYVVIIGDPDHVHHIQSRVRKIAWKIAESTGRYLFVCVASDESSLPGTPSLLLKDHALEYQELYGTE
jgi:hypothetical protein